MGELEQDLSGLKTSPSSGNDHISPENSEKLVQKICRFISAHQAMQGSSFPRLTAFYTDRINGSHTTER